MPVNSSAVEIGQWFLKFELELFCGVLFTRHGDHFDKNRLNHNTGTAPLSESDVVLAW